MPLKLPPLSQKLKHQQTDQNQANHGLRGGAYKRLQKAFTDIVSWASESSDTESAFDAAADYMERFSADNIANSVASVCQQLLKPAIEQLTKEGSITEDLTSAALTVNDQLFSLLLMRDRELRDIVNVTRTLIQRSIFPTLDGLQDPQTVLPIALLDPDALYEGFYQQESYKRLKPFFSGSLTLASALRQSQGRNDHLRVQIQKHVGATLKGQEVRRKEIILRAFLAWRLATKNEKDGNKLLGRTADAESETEKVKQQYASLFSTHTLTKKHSTDIQSYLRRELHNISRLYESSRVVAEKFRTMNGELHKTYATENESALVELRDMATEAKERENMWRDVLDQIKFGPSDNDFETFNRARVSMEQRDSAENPGGMKTLLVWVRTLVSPFPRASQLVVVGKPSEDSSSITDDDPILRTDGKFSVVASHMLILHSLSPGTVTYREVEDAFELQSMKIFDTVITRYENLGLEEVANLLREWRSTRDSTMSQDLLPTILALLFARFTGCVGTHPFLPPRKGSDDWNLWAKSVPGFRSHFEAESAAAKFRNIGRPIDVVNAKRQRFEGRMETLLKGNTLSTQVFQELTRKWFKLFRSASLSDRRREKLWPLLPRDAQRFTLFKSVPRDLSMNSKFDTSLWRFADEELLPPFGPYLMKVFYHYSTVDSSHASSPSMSFEEFSTLMQDCGLLSRLPQNVLYKTFYHCAEAREGTDAKLKENHFLSLVFRIAFLIETPTETESDLEFQKRSLSLLIQRVVHKAQGSATLTFSRAMRSEPMEEVLEGADSLLKRAFGQYAGSDKLLNEKEFIRFSSDAKLMDNICTVQAVQTLFNKIPSHIVLNPAGNVCIEFSQFPELLGALSCFKIPAPFLALDAKMKRFLELYVASMPLKSK